MLDRIYLNALLDKYAVNVEGATAAAESIHPILQNWGNGFLLKAEFSGSLAKGTGISISTDADIFLSMGSTTPGTLADMYNTLCDAVTGAGLPVRKQDVSVGTTVNDYSIDLVPGRRQSQHGTEHSLYRNRTGSWTKTDVAHHIELVSGSGRTDEIRLLKIWRTRHRLRFPSFYLELVSLGSLRYARHGELVANFRRALQYLRDDFCGARYVDPSNSNNTVSDDCTPAQKLAIAAQARESLNKKTWQEVVW